MGFIVQTSCYSKHKGPIKACDLKDLRDKIKVIDPEKVVLLPGDNCDGKQIQLSLACNEGCLDQESTWNYLRSKKETVNIEVMATCTECNRERISKELSHLDLDHCK